MKKKDTFQIFITSKFSFLSKLCQCHMWTRSMLDSDTHICRRDSSWSQSRARGVPGLWCHSLAGASGVSHCSGCHSLQWVPVQAPGLGVSWEHLQQLQGEWEAQCQWLQQPPGVWYHLQGGEASVSPPNHVCGVCYNIPEQAHHYFVEISLFILIRKVKDQREILIMNNLRRIPS